MAIVAQLLVQGNGSQSAVPTAKASSVNLSEMQILRPIWQSTEPETPAYVF